MRVLKLLIISTVLLISGELSAQVSIHFEFGTPPAWGPTGYTDVRYYYLPDVEAYYDIRSSMFICFDGTKWTRRAHLPGRYRNYDLYNGYKVVMTDYRGERPYTHFADYRTKYGKGYRDHHQQTYKESKENKRHDDNNGMQRGAPGNKKDHGNGHGIGHKK